jgi:outer membrane murein-binding lipoprotein Lpp
MSDRVEIPSVALKSIATTTAVVEQMVTHVQTLNANLERLLLDNDAVKRAALATSQHADAMSKENSNNEK